MKRLICWWHGHDYFMGRGVLAEPGYPLARLTICLRCGVRCLERLDQRPDVSDVFEARPYS